MVLSYYFNLFSLVEKGVYNLVDLADQFGLPSMPKREILENGFKKLIKEGDCKERLLRTYKYASIIIFSLMSNLLFDGKTTAYNIWVLSLIWLMKRIWSKDVTTTPRGKVELWLCNEVQGSVKIVITWCIDNILKVIKVGYTKKV